MAKSIKLDWKPLKRLAGKLAKVDLARLPLLFRVPLRRLKVVFTAAMIAALFLAIAATAWHVWELNRQKRWIAATNRMQVLAQRQIKYAREALLGNELAFTILERSGLAIDEVLQGLIAGNDEIPPSPAAIQPRLSEIERHWLAVKANSLKLLAQRDLLTQFKGDLDLIKRGSAEILEQIEQLNALLPKEAVREREYVHQLAVWSQRTVINASALMTADVPDPNSANILSEDDREFRRALDALQRGNKQLGVGAVLNPNKKLEELSSTYAKLEPVLARIMTYVPELTSTKQGVSAALEEDQQIIDLAQALAADYEALRHNLSLGLAVGFASLALTSLIMLGLTNVAEARERAEETARENKRNQDAILRLLNEMGDLAEGDLTIRATVTEDITGAIADSVNYAIDEIRMLVSNINRATTQVTQATSEAKQISDELLAAAERQSQQIALASESIDAMTRSILNVSQNAAESTRVAELSLAAAKKGGDSVRQSIASMNALRDQIQETAKRIKRLGESSQEIGEIVELISDITEQTNVLALNAAIQAAAAGEAGRGFSVVAEEVQRLAERSANATRRIGAIVKAIQGDTQDVIHAMEISTQGVVKGTALSDAAGRSLQEIESVSVQLARLIQDISLATQDQVRTAERITQNMREILQVTQQTSDGARRNTQAMDQLNALAEELMVSVAGFKL